MTEYVVKLRDSRRHAQQRAFIESPAKRKIVRAGRRGGKTVGAATLAVRGFLNGRRILYATPTADQMETFWREVKNALWAPIDGKVFTKNEVEHFVELPRSTQRIRAKTAWNPDTLRGDYADLLILDEWQLMDEDAWEMVGAPMLMDNDGDAVFIYTPPSLRSRSMTKARDPRHAAKMFEAAKADETGRWAAFHFSSHDNPFISKDALTEITKDMTTSAYRQEIMAEDLEDVPGALLPHATFDYRPKMPDRDQFVKIVVAVDPAATSDPTSDETGIVVAGKTLDGKCYVLADRSCRVSPDRWARAAIAARDEFGANYIVAEKNNGGEMVTLTIRTVDSDATVKMVWAKVGKAVRAEPIVALYQQRRMLHPSPFPYLESEWSEWVPGSGPSPNRLDACVYAGSELMLKGYSGDPLKQVMFA